MLSHGEALVKWKTAPTTWSEPSSEAQRASLTSGERVALERADVLSLGTLGALGDLELHLLVLVERLVAARRDRGVVSEHIRGSVVGSDEAEALFSVEPLDGACCHDEISFKRDASIPGPGTAGRLPLVNLPADRADREDLTTCDQP